MVLGVNEPFCLQLGMACVAKGHYREWDGLAEAMGEQIDRPIELRYFFTEPLLIEAAGKGEIDGVICKRWTALRAAKAAGQYLDQLADVSMPAVLKSVDTLELGIKRSITLIPPQGDLHGILFTLDNSPIKTVADLGGKKLAIGNEDSYEKSYSVHKLLADYKVQPQLQTAGTCLEAALAVKEGKADAAVLSSYAYLFGTFRAVDMPAHRIIGQTEPIPFVTIGFFGKIEAASRDRLRQYLHQLSTKDQGVPADLGPTRILPPARWQPVELNQP